MTQEEIQTIIKRANENSTRQYELGYEKAKEQLIEKACEWLAPTFKDLAGYYSGSELLDDFKKAMEE